MLLLFSVLDLSAETTADDVKDRLRDQSIRESRLRVRRQRSGLQGSIKIVVVRTSADLLQTT